MGVIQVIDTNNVSHILEAVEGWRVMEIIREHGFEVGGLCGGACACATCHVEVHAEWAGKLYPANDDEEAMLDEVPVLVADFAPFLPDYLHRRFKRTRSQTRGQWLR